MRVRNITTCALGFAAALTLVASPLTAQTQDTAKLRRTTSEQRIGISKGEVVSAPRVDTVFVTRYDTVRVNNTIVRVDTVTVVPPAPISMPKIVGPMYWGLYAGNTRPAGNIDRLYTNGYHAGGVIGYENQHSFWGLRANADLAQINREQGRATALVGTGTPLLWTLGADLKIKPLNFSGWDLYAIGGGQFNAYKRIATARSDNSSLGFCGAGFDGHPGSDSCYTPASDTKWKGALGFNFGAGLDFHIGSQDMFFEGRYQTMQKDGGTTWMLPISLGVRYF